MPLEMKNILLHGFKCAGILFTRERDANPQAHKRAVAADPSVGAAAVPKFVNASPCERCTTTHPLLPALG